MQASRALDWPERLAPARDCLERAAAAAGEGLAGLLSANDEAQPMLAAYRALRHYARACEALYPMTPHLRPVSQFFLEPAAREDKTRLAGLAALALGGDSPLSVDRLLRRRIDSAHRQN